MEKQKAKLKPLKPLYLVVYYIAFTIAWVLVHLVFHIRVIGKENLEKKDFVLAPNHVNALDPLYIILARGFKKKMLIMGKEELFGKNFLGDFFFNLAGVFPVSRGTGDKEALNEAVEDVKSGRGLLIFPEGTRSKDGELGKVKSGAFVVAMQTQADIIPCYIWYDGGSQKVRLFRRVTVIFGEPLSMEKLGLEGEYSAKKLRAAKQIYIQSLEDLKTNNKDRL